MADRNAAPLGEEPGSALGVEDVVGVTVVALASEN